MDSIFSQRKGALELLKSLRPQKVNQKSIDPPEGLFVRCDGCHTGHPKSILKDNCYVCPKCGNHLKIGAPTRFSMIFDDGNYKEVLKKTVRYNPISFPEYEKKLEGLSKKSGLSEAAVTAVGMISGKKTVVSVLDCSFLMGSMGSVVGEKITQSVEYAKKNKLPLIIFSASGGARMQEGIFSLMQMAKTSAALKRFSDEGGFYLSYLTNPTTGGVTASFASLGDIILAEPGALIGFAGPRVIEQTIHQKLPEGFQRAEFVLEHGFVDHIVSRKEMRETIARLLNFHTNGR